MSQTATAAAVVERLRVMQTGIEVTRTRGSAADNEVERIIARAALAGFSTIAVGMTQVREAIRQTHTTLAAVHTAISDASAAVTRAPVHESPAQAMTELGQAGQHLKTAHDGIIASIGQVDETRTLAMRVLHGGDPGPLLSILEMVKQNLVQVLHTGTAAQQSLTALIHSAQKMGRSDN